MAEGDRAADGGLPDGPRHEARPVDVAEVHRHVLAACRTWGLDTPDHQSQPQGPPRRGRLLLGRGGQRRHRPADDTGGGALPHRRRSQDPRAGARSRGRPRHEPWVLFRAEALARGVRSVVALPLLAGPLDLGVATLHGSRPVVARQLQGRWRVAWSSSRPRECWLSGSVWTWGGRSTCREPRRSPTAQPQRGRPRDRHQPDRRHGAAAPRRRGRPGLSRRYCSVDRVGSVLSSCS